MMKIGNMYVFKQFCRAKNCCLCAEIFTSSRSAIGGSNNDKVLGEINKGEVFQLIAMKQTNSGFVLLQILTGTTLGWILFLEETDITKVKYSHYFRGLKPPTQRKTNKQNKKV